MGRSAGRNPATRREFNPVRSGPGTHSLRVTARCGCLAARPGCAASPASVTAGSRTKGQRDRPRRAHHHGRRQGRATASSHVRSTSPSVPGTDGRSPRAVGGPDGRAGVGGAVRARRWRALRAPRIPRPHDRAPGTPHTPRGARGPTNYVAASEVKSTACGGAPRPRASSPALMTGRARSADPFDISGVGSADAMVDVGIRWDRRRRGIGFARVLRSAPRQQALLPRWAINHCGRSLSKHPGRRQCRTG